MSVRPRDQKPPTNELFADKSEGEIIASQSEYHGRGNENHRSCKNIINISLLS